MGDGPAGSCARGRPLMTGHGRSRLAAAARRVGQALLNTTFDYRTRLIEGEATFLEETAQADGPAAASANLPYQLGAAQIPNRGA